jgi:diaminopimelate epimerase
VQPTSENSIRVRTYERGVEAETLACGTGVTASALLTKKILGLDSPIRVQVQSGEFLEVSFVSDGDSFSGVHLKGPAQATFEGTLSMESFS